MRHDWIEDVLAVIDAGSFARAADRRNITQSAFTRRIDAIERALGGPLFDRGRKPIALMPSVRILEPSLRKVLDAQRVVFREACQVATGAGTSVTLACQHAITATITPRLVRRFADAGWEPVTVRSGNRDECLLSALSGAADLVVTHAVVDSPAEVGAGFVEHTIGTDALIPVGLPGAGPDDQGSLPVIAYPSDVYFGVIVERALWPRLPAGVIPRKRAETALTLAAYRYALDGIGVAWLPRSLVSEDLQSGRLARVMTAGPEQPLDIRVMRLAEPLRAAALSAWTLVKGSGDDA
ncbi:MAG: LysR family transcriptional regulator [Azospirillaceae bacterium]